MITKDIIESRLAIERPTWRDDALTYLVTDTVSTSKVFNDVQERIKGMTKPTIKRVIFNDPATIILWGDNTKTVVQCQEGDDYDKEKGFVMAYLKKLLGNKNEFNKEINKWVYDT